MTSIAGRSWWYTLLVLLLGGAVVLFGSASTGFLLDDWYIAGDWALGGAGAVVDEDLLLARPGALLAYVSTFALGQGSPLAVQLLQGLWLLVCVGLLHRLLMRYFPLAASSAMVALWVLLPNRMSLEMWGAAVVANVSLALLLGACLALGQRPLTWRWIALAGVLACASGLTYEASLLPAALAFVVLPRTASRRARLRSAVTGALVIGATGLWLLVNMHPTKGVHNKVGGLTQLFDAHFGWGIAPRGPLAEALLVLVLVGSALVVAMTVRRSDQYWQRWQVQSVIVGWVVLLSGSAAFAVYFYAPLGAGDRASYLSSIGGAMVLVGLIGLIAQRLPVLGAAAGVALVLLALPTRAERVDVWQTAARDSANIADEIRRVPTSCERIVVGPEPIQQQNVAVFLDQSNVRGAVKLLKGSKDVGGGMAYGVEAFESVPEECRVDIRPVSSLVPDVDLAP